MDMSSVAASLQSCLSMLVLDKAMGMDAQSMATLLQDMEVPQPAAAVLQPKAGSMDIRA